MGMFKEIAKKMPYIRKVVQARDLYMGLYENVLNEKNALAQKLDEANIEIMDIAKKLDDNSHNLSVYVEKSDILFKEKEKLEGEIEENKRKLFKLEDECEMLKCEIEKRNWEKHTQNMISGEFWNTHYAKGGNSGTGSYGRLAAFKSEIINNFIGKNNIETVLEIGCGDGNQLKMINYKQYVGVDVSENIIKKNRDIYADDNGKSFFCTLTERDKYADRKYDMTLSMDVIFHLLEDEVFEAYMNDLFNLSEKYVVIYSSNHEEYTRWAEYRHRNFTGFVQEHFPEWGIKRYIPNKYPYIIGQEEETSAADFYFFEKR